MAALAADADEPTDDKSRLIQTIEQAFAKPTRKGVRAATPAVKQLLAVDKREFERCLSHLKSLTYEDPAIKADALRILPILLEADVASLERLVNCALNLSVIATGFHRRLLTRCRGVIGDFLTRDPNRTKLPVTEAIASILQSESSLGDQYEMS